MAGISLDADLGPIEVVANLSAELGRQNDLNEKRYEEMRRRNQLRTQVPQDIRKFASGVADAGGDNFGVNLGGPNAGFYWILRRLSVGPVTWVYTPIANMGAVFLVTANAGVPEGGTINGTAGLQNVAALLPTTEIVAQSLIVPSVATFSGRQVVMAPGESLVCVFVAPTAGKPFACSAFFEVHRQIGAAEEYQA